MHIIGKHRYGREAYPVSRVSASDAALRNRNIVGGTGLTQPFTPNTSTIAAILFTPRVSGVMQVSATVAVQNGANPETYSMGLLIFTGTGLTVTGGEATVDGWVIGSNTPPIVGGVIGAPVATVGDFTALATGEEGALANFAVSTPPQPLGVPVVAAVVLSELGGGNPLAQISIANISIMELP